MCIRDSLCTTPNASEKRGEGLRLDEKSCKPKLECKRMAGRGPGMLDASNVAWGATAADWSATGSPGTAAMVQPTIRSNFADTALWVGSLTTDEDGTAEVK